MTITDDGVGLPAGFRPGLAGLGTRIVTSFVQDLGGRIRWEGAPGGGTTGRVRGPAASDGAVGTGPSLGRVSRRGGRGRCGA